MRIVKGRIHRLLAGAPFLTRRARVVHWAKWAADQPGAATSYLFGGIPGIGTGTHTDCSGFVVAVYRKVGLALPRTSQLQYEKAKSHPRVARPADLIFYNYEGPHSHVGIKIRRGWMVADQHTGSGIVRVRIDYAHRDGRASYL
jgi:cell wall-associated NlpC family hydrolase